MREDFPRGRVTSRSLKSTVFASHDGEWEVSGTCPHTASIPVNVFMRHFIHPLRCYCCSCIYTPQSNSAALLEHALPADYSCAFPSQ